MHGHGSFCVNTCSLNPEKQLVSWQKKWNEWKEKNTWGSNGSCWHLGLHCILPGLRVVVTGNRHGWSIVRLWWFHPVHCFPVAHPHHSPPSLLIISLSSPCCFPVISPSLPIVVSPSLLIVVSLLSHHSLSLSSLIVGCWVVGCWVVCCPPSLSVTFTLCFQQATACGGVGHGLSGVSNHCYQ